MIYNVIALTCGYVENALVSHLAFSYNREEPFTSPREALTDLAHGFLDMWLDNYSFNQPNYSKCCLAASKKAANLHCPTCGKGLQAHLFTQGDLDEFTESIVSYATGTADSCGNADDYLRGWWPWTGWKEFMAIPVEQHIHVFENAELLLLACLDPEKVPDFMKEALLEWRKHARFDWIFNDIEGGIDTVMLPAEYLQALAGDDWFRECQIKRTDMPENTRVLLDTWLAANPQRQAEEAE